ncbi:cation transporter [Pseudomonas capeferrum]|uniref:cation diffusion facilitator family transporter n=1 Tax=Pseudomonas capeferrum TaxID=1495066 RepID=UPI0015E43FB7|nr:cation transporter [Pseudomonas capeferrum]MBA1202148.1 cation transporter [Pseudomonas capeferrum]
MLRQLHSEQGILRISIAGTLVVAVFGIIVGLQAGSDAIVFDAFYSLIDAIMSGLALTVAILITRHTKEEGVRRLAERFNMGFWHLEPMVLALNGTLLCVVALYALVNSIISVLEGGKTLEFGIAILYAAVSATVCFTLALLEHHRNKEIRSDFVALDIKGWIMAGSISFALLIAFALAVLAQGTRYAWVAPYVDPVVLGTICLIIIPVPLSTVRKAWSEILMVTPTELKVHVDTVARRVVEESGFSGYQTYVAKVGRARQIELYFIVPSGWPAMTLDEWDAIRDRVGQEIGDEGPDRWLTISFTTDPEWSR